jgi:S1-C subfamily serine protease
MENKITSKTAFIIALAIFFGLAGGVVGELLARVYLIDSLYNVPLYGDINYSGLNTRSNLIISGGRQVVVEQNDKIISTVNSVRGGLAGIYKKQASLNAKNFTPVDFYKAKEAIGQALALTSDGWLVTSFQLSDKPAEFGQYVAITNDNKVYVIDRVVKDKFSKFVFFHIAIRDLPVTRFAPAGAVKNGELLIAADWQGIAWSSSVIDANNYIGAIFSDLPQDRVVLKDVLPKDLSAAAVFNLAGETVALIDGEGRIEPISHFSAAINSLFRLKAIRRPSLGVYYLSADSLVASTDKIAAGNADLAAGRGAVIYKDAKGGAVVKGSAAEKAGLKDGDTILTVDGTELGHGNNLSNLLQAFSIGEKITVDYLRNGEKKEIQVTIGELK